MRTLELTDVVVLADGLMEAAIDNEVILLKSDEGTYAALGNVGSHIGAFLKTPIAIGDLCTRLTDLYDVDAATCQADVLEFLATLHQAGLLIVTP